MKVFLISTPSQAFFLLKSPYFIDSNSILIVLKTNLDNPQRILNYLSTLNWKEILIWDIDGVSHYRNYYKIFKFNFLLKYFKLKFGSPLQIFMGSYDNLFQLSFVAKFEKNAKIFLLYDGLQMVNVSNLRRLNPDKGIRLFSWIFKLANLRQPEIKKLTFVSPLNLIVPDDDNLIIINKNDFHHPLLDVNLVYFIGQPLIDMGIVSKYDFIKMMKQIRDKYRDFRIEYIPHPKESQRSRLIIKEYFQILELDIIFEEYYTSCDLFAGGIISFYSSVLINMNYLSYPGNIVAYKIFNQDLIRKSSITNIEHIYDYFELNENSKFKVVNFESAVEI